MARALLRDPKTVAPAALILCIAVLAVAATWLTPFAPNRIGVGPYLQGPTWSHPAGTDGFGRDQLSRIMVGAQISLKVAIVVALASISVGLVLGLSVGYFRGTGDFVVGRMLDVIFAFPALLLALVLTAIRGPGIPTVILALSIIHVPTVTRLVRSLALAERERDYVRAAVVTGSSHLRIMWLHIAPNILSPILVMTATVMSHAVLAEAALSYLGFGAQPPAASWGRMLTEGSPYVTTKPYLVIFPGVAIVLLVLALNLFGDGLRDHLDPHARQIADTPVTA